MNKLYEKHFNGFWSIMSGIILLIFAFIALYASLNTQDNNKNTIEVFNSNVETTVVETTTIESTIEESTEAETNKKTYKKSDINFDAEFPYFIRINRAQNYTIIYAMDKKGKYSIPYKAFICSTGYYPKDTPLGTFETSDMYPWRLMVDYTYSQYAIRINGPIMLHSLPYYKQSKDTLKYEEYNRLGQPASLGCIRYQVKDIRWIYKNCPVGTTVEIYSDANEVPPLEIPTIELINENNPNKNWDPTDPDKNNPWQKNKKNSKKSKEVLRVEENNQDTTTDD